MYAKVRPAFLRRFGRNVLGGVREREHAREVRHVGESVECRAAGAGRGGSPATVAAALDGKANFYFADSAQTGSTGTRYSPLCAVLHSCVALKGLSAPPLAT